MFQQKGDRLYLMGYPNPGETGNRVDRANDGSNGLADAIYVDHFDELIAGAERNVTRSDIVDSLMRRK